jgi:iron complex transport system substrate-binding protein
MTEFVSPSARRRLLVACFGVVLAFACREKTTAPKAEEGLRVASLSPAITETTLALGEKRRLVAISDYCPKELTLPRVGSSFTPRLEELYRIHPTLVLTTETLSAEKKDLKKLPATFVELPWLTTADVAKSTRRLGVLLGAETKAESLAARFEAALSVAPKANAPRVLLLLGDSDQGNAVYYFIKRGSVHNDLLEAAGGTNAIVGETVGVPELSAERILELDPDVILVLSDERDQAMALRRLTGLGRLRPLRAVRDGKTGVFAAPALLSTGPHLAEYVPLLAAKLNALAKTTASGGSL